MRYLALCILLCSWECGVGGLRLSPDPIGVSIAREKIRKEKCQEWSREDGLASSTYHALLNFKKKNTLPTDKVTGSGEGVGATTTWTTSTCLGPEEVEDSCLGEFGGEHGSGFSLSAAYPDRTGHCFNPGFIAVATAPALGGLGTANTGRNL